MNVLVSILAVPPGQLHLEDSAAALPGATLGLSPVGPGNLPDEGEPETEALPGFGGAGGTVEGLEDPLPLALGHARTAVQDQEAHPGVLAALHAGLDRALAAVSASVLEAVAHEASQEARVAGDHHGFARDLDIVSGSLFGQEGQQVHRLSAGSGATGLQPAGLEHLIDDAVELGHVSRGPLLLRLRAGHHLEGQAKPRQRRAQLVGGVNEHTPLGLDEALDAIGGPVEAARELGHLVATLDRGPGLQIATAEVLHPLPQPLEAPLEAPREAAHERPRSDRHRHPQEAEEQEEGCGASPGGCMRRATKVRP